MTKPIDKYLAILNALKTIGSAEPKVLFRSVLNDLDIDEDQYASSSFYRHLNELEDKNELIAKYFDKDGIEQDASEAQKGNIRKIIFHPQERNKFTGSKILELYGAKVVGNSVLKNDISFNAGSLQVESENETLLYFNLSNSFTCLRAHDEGFEMNILFSRVKQGDTSQSYERVEDSFGKRTLWIQVPLPGISSFKGDEKSGHCLVSLVDKETILVRDLNSQNGVRVFQPGEEIIYEHIKRGDALGMETETSSWSMISMKDDGVMLEAQKEHKFTSPLILQLSKDFRILITRN